MSFVNDTVRLATGGRDFDSATDGEVQVSCRQNSVAAVATPLAVDDRLCFLRGLFIVNPMNETLEWAPEIVTGSPNILASPF